MPIVSAGSGVEAVFTQSVTLGRANLPLTFTKYHRQFKPLSEYSKCYSSKSALISRKCKLKDCATFRRLEQNFDNDNKIRQFRFVCEIRSHYTHSSVLWNHTMGSCIFFIMLKSKATARKSIIVCTSFFFNCQAKYKVSLRFFFSILQINVLFFFFNLLQELFRPPVQSIGRGGSVEADSPGKHLLNYTTTSTSFICTIYTLD